MDSGPRLSVAEMKEDASAAEANVRPPQAESAELRAFVGLCREAGIAPRRSSDRKRLFAEMKSRLRSGSALSDRDTGGGGGGSGGGEAVAARPATIGNALMIFLAGLLSFLLAGSQELKAIVARANRNTLLIKFGRFVCDLPDSSLQIFNNRCRERIEAIRHEMREAKTRTLSALLQTAALEIGLAQYGDGDGDDDGKGLSVTKHPTWPADLKKQKFKPLGPKAVLMQIDRQVELCQRVGLYAVYLRIVDELRYAPIDEQSGKGLRRDGGGRGRGGGGTNGDGDQSVNQKSKLTNCLLSPPTVARNPSAPPVVTACPTTPMDVSQTQRAFSPLPSSLPFPSFSSQNPSAMSAAAPMMPSAEQPPPVSSLQSSPNPQSSSFASPFGGSIHTYHPPGSGPPPTAVSPDSGPPVHQLHNKRSRQPQPPLHHPPRPPNPLEDFRGGGGGGCDGFGGAFASDLSPHPKRLRHRNNHHPDDDDDDPTTTATTMTPSMPMSTRDDHNAEAQVSLPEDDPTLQYWA